jgi:hypothetical protein
VCVCVCVCSCDRACVLASVFVFAYVESNRWKCDISHSILFFIDWITFSRHRRNHILACLGFREEYHAKKSLDELSNSLESEIAVRRDGTTKSVPTKELVPGDIVLLVGGTVGKQARNDGLYLCRSSRHNNIPFVLSHTSTLPFSPSPS